MKNIQTDRDETRNLSGVSVHTGFPNPAAESPLANPDFNRLLIRHPVATYCMRISGHAWEERGIFDGDIIVIDRAVSAGSGDLAVWWQDDSFMIGKAYSIAAWGTVTAIIHRYQP